MNLEELKRKREENLKAHKKKKRAYYLKSKLQKNNTQTKVKVSNKINYEIELFSGDFGLKLKEIAQKQKKHVESREEVIKQKLQEYQQKKKQYYEQHKTKRLEYDKEYREKKKEQLKEYRKEYYKRNREKILAKQKENREKKRNGQ